MNLDLNFFLKYNLKWCVILYLSHDNHWLSVNKNAWHGMPSLTTIYFTYQGKACLHLTGHLVLLKACPLIQPSTPKIDSTYSLPFPSSASSNRSTSHIAFCSITFYPSFSGMHAEYIACCLKHKLPTVLSYKHTFSVNSILALCCLSVCCHVGNVFIGL